jgi:SAM-dependent methyltransferase
MNNWLVYRTIRKAIRENGAEGPVLMAPCGYGWFFEKFKRDGIPIVGIDIDPKTVGWARTAVVPAPPVFEGNVLEMPFKDGEFDFVVNNRFQLHFDQDFRAKALKELARVARRHVLVHYDTMSVRQFLRKLRGVRKPVRDTAHIKTWRKTLRKERKRLFDREQMVAEGAAAGLHVKKLYPVCFALSDRTYCLYEKGSTARG